MPYIRFDTFPNSIGIGRTAFNVSFKGGTLADWCGEVDEVMKDETEIDEATYTALVTENAKHNDAIPLPEPPQPAPSILDILLADKNLAPETTAALAQLKG